MTDNYNMQVIETALRILYILDTLEQAMSFDKILYVDFMISYLNDFDVTQKNLLPPSPFRKEELYIRNKVILNAINYLLIRKLIDILFKKNGIYYISNNNTKMLTDLINNSYKKQLLEQLAWIKINISNKSEIEIKQYIVSTLASTAPEYINYGLINKELFNYVK